MDMGVWEGIKKLNHRPGYTILGHISSYCRIKNEYHFPGHEELNQFQQPSFPSDLSEGFDVATEKEDNQASISITPILLAIQQSSFLGANVHFITFRNNLNKILNTPYNRNSPWKIGAQRFNHPYFGHCIGLHVIHVEESQNEQQKRWCYWGRKFEQLCTNISSVDEGLDREYCTLVLSRLGNFRIIIAAEIDCYQTENTTFPEHVRKAKFLPTDFIELKTNRCLNQHTSSSYYKHKLRNVWIQSMLAGVPNIIFGFRDDKGILTHLKTYSTHSLPGISKENGGNWDPDCCLKFAQAALEMLYANVNGDDTYILHYLPTKQIISLQKDENKMLNKSICNLSWMESLSRGQPCSSSCSTFTL